MDLMYFVNALWLGFIVATIFGFIFSFLKFFVHFHREETKVRAEQMSAILQLETVFHKGSELFLVFEPLKNKFVTQGSTVEEVSKFIVEHYKGKTVFIVEEGKEMIKLFNHTENA